ncbi:Hypothetical predicted protein [Lecanosticta acicola]|uniref:Apple domain-containing protein n=1 Tax=Lecanosticta acicola TaxID=111012 RepID=A0AAI8YSY0_9PEZI|nr:Hypothetical predicted protein [Lecanosticta acicola]
MKAVLATAAAVFLAAAGVSSAATCNTDTPVADLCPGCDGQNITDADTKWVVSCDYRSHGVAEQAIQGDITLEGCLKACDAANKCYGANLAANGSCSILTGDQKSLAEQKGVINLFRLAESNAETTEHVKMTSTVFGGGLTQTSSASPITTTTNAPSPSSSPECDLELNTLCPTCDGVEVGNANGGKYTIVCDFELTSSNGSYYPQEALTPAGCINQCDQLDFCAGASYFDFKDCEIAKEGGDLTSTSNAGYTAFVPVTTTAGAASSPVPTTSKVSITGTVTDPTYSTLPTSSGCDANAMACPVCDGISVPDKLNSSYTVVCGMEPVCESEPIRDNVASQELCLEACDQDVTCLAVKWYSQDKSCHLCQQGLEQGAQSGGLPYIVFVADGDDNNKTATSSSRKGSTTSSTTSKPTLSSTITDFPAPFSPTTTSKSVSAKIGPVGPVIPSSIAAAGTQRPETAFNPGGPIINITATTSAIPANITNGAEVTCPDSSGNVYIDPESGNYYEVNCDSVFSGAAHSRYLSASDFSACAASCTGSCDGVQFGFSTRCGLYTDISVVAGATGWTIGASIPAPTPDASTTSTKTTPTSVKATATAAPAPPKYGNGTRS